MDGGLPGLRPAGGAVGAGRAGPGIAADQGQGLVEGLEGVVGVGGGHPEPFCSASASASAAQRRARSAALREASATAVAGSVPVASAWAAA